MRPRLAVVIFMGFTECGKRSLEGRQWLRASQDIAKISPNQRFHGFSRFPPGSCLQPSFFAPLHLVRRSKALRLRRDLCRSPLLPRLRLAPALRHERDDICGAGEGLSFADDRGLHESDTASRSSTAWASTCLGYLYKASNYCRPYEVACIERQETSVRLKRPQSSSSGFQARWAWRARGARTSGGLPQKLLHDMRVSKN